MNHKTLRNRFFLTCYFVFFSVSLFSQDVNYEYIPASGEGCSPFKVQFTNTSNPDPAKPGGNISSFTWDFGDGTPTETYDISNIGETLEHTFNSATKQMFNITLTLTLIDDPKPKKNIQSVFVYTADHASINPVYTADCGGVDTFKNGSTLNSSGSDTHSSTWDFGDGSSLPAGLENVTHSYTITNDTTLVIKMKISNMCGVDSTTTNITLYKKDNQIQTNAGDTICRSQSVQFLNPGNKPGMTYQWDFGDGTTDGTSNPSHSYPNPGNYTVQLTTDISGGNQCNDINTSSITVLDGPDAAFGMAYAPGCDSLHVTFSDSTTGLQDVWNWDFGNGQTSTDQNPAGLINYDSAGNYPIKLLVSNNTNSCADSLLKTLTVPATPLASFSTSNVCVGQTGTFVDHSTISFGSINSWFWQFPDGTDINQNPTRLFITAGTIPVTLTVSTGSCQDDTTINITIEALPVPGFSAPTYKDCPPLKLNFTNSSNIKSVTFDWNFGDGDTSKAKSPTHIFENKTLKDTVYPVKLIAYTAFNCSDSVVKNVTVYQQPVSLFTSDIPEMPACNPVRINYASTSTGASTIQWNFGDGTKSTVSPVTHNYDNPNHYFKYFKTFLVATSSHNCHDTSEIQYITVYPLPRIDFVIDSTDHCQPAVIKFVAPIESSASYFWDFGDGDTLSTNNVETTHSYINDSTFDFKYHIKFRSQNEFSCKDSAVDSLTIHPSPIANFTRSPANPLIHPGTVQINDLSEQHANWIYRWNYGQHPGDTVISYSPPDFTYDRWGRYLLSLMVIDNNNCSDTLVDTVVIIAPPATLDFDLDTLSGCPILPVHFTDRSINTDTSTYQWDFGDGGDAYTVNPTHDFYDNGIMTITLHADDFNGNSYSKDTAIEVYELPSAEFEIVPEHIIVPDQPVTCHPLFPRTEETYQWNFGDGSAMDTVRDPSHLYIKAGEYSISLIVTSSHGCVDSLTKNNIALADTGGEILFPNAFTPRLTGGSGSGSITSGDGADELFFAPIQESVVEYHLEVYDRWGERLFHSDSKDIGWDGYYKNKLCKQDVYVWKVTGKYANGRPFTKSGTVTLIHDKNKQ